MAFKRTLKEAVEIANHKMNEGKPFMYTTAKEGGVKKIGYVIRRGDKLFYLDIHGKVGEEVKSVDYLM